MPLNSKRALKVFLCHASGDKPYVRELYKRLLREGIDAWLDQEKLLPGQDWRVEIPRAVRAADVVVICLSNKSITKEGYIQKEIKFALDVADEKPDGTIFLIPARIEDCPVPEKLSRWQWVDLFEENGYTRLLRSLKLDAETIGADKPTSYEDSDDELEQKLEQLYTEGLAAYYTEDWNKACQRFQAILSERPNHLNALEKLEEAELQRDLSKLYKQAVDANQAQDWQSAIKAWEELLKKSPEYRDAAQLFRKVKQQKQLSDLYTEAKKLHAAQKWQAVVKVFDQILLIDPSHSDPDNLLPAARQEAANIKRLADLNDMYSQAVREIDMKRWQEARKLLEQVHKSQIGFLETELLLRKVEDELRMVEEGNQRNNQINTLYEQAHGLVRTKSWRKALDKIEEIRKLDVHFEDKDGIVEKIQAALVQEEQQAQRQNQLAALYADAVRLLKEEKYTEALEKWEEVKKIDSKYPDRQWVQRTARKELVKAGKVSPPTKNELPWKVIVPVIVVLGLATILLFNLSIFSPDYDDFDNPQNDGGLNTNLWNANISPPGYAEQQNGALVVSLEAANTVANIVAEKKMIADRDQAFGASVLLSNNVIFPDGDAGFTLNFKDASEKDVYYVCVIGNYDTIEAWCEVFGRTDTAEYSSKRIPTSYNVWHDFLIKLDSEMNASFYIDDQLVGNYTPSDAAQLVNSEFTFYLNAYSPSKRIIEAHFDNVKIE